MICVAAVLIVEDEFDAAEPLMLYLQRRGHTVRCVPNGRDALAALITERPDAAILDLRMPVMDGLEFLQVIRSYLRWYSLPVIVVTAVPHGPMLDRVQSLGVTKVFQKAAMNYDEVAAAVDEAVLTAANDGYSSGSH